jgi:hypothetical protein
MRTVVAFMMALVLLSIITVCPLIACPLVDGSGAASKGCCHKQQPAPRPCTLQVCPYAILESGKTVAMIAQTLTVGLLPISPEAPTSGPFSSIQVANRIPDSAGLFLRNHVLLI